MLWRFLSEREGKRGGGLTDPFVNPERDVELEAARGGAGRLCLRRGGFCRRGWRARFVCKAFFGMEPYAEGKLPRVMLVEGSAPVAAQAGQFIKFDEISSSHGGHTSVAASLTRSSLDCMRRSGAPCSFAEHPWVRQP